MAEKPLNEGLTKGQYKDGGLSKPNPGKTIKPPAPPSPPPPPKK